MTDAQKDVREFVSNFKIYCEKYNKTKPVFRAGDYNVLRNDGFWALGENVSYSQAKWWRDYYNTMYPQTGTYKAMRRVHRPKED